MPGIKIYEMLAKNIIKRGLATPAPIADKVPIAIRYLSVLSANLKRERNEV